MLSKTRSYFSYLRTALCVAIVGAPLQPATAQSVSLNLSSYKGKVVYLDFWASWCGPCKQSFPYMKGLVQKYGPNGFVVVTVNLDRSRPQAEAFMHKIGVTLPVTYDSGGVIAKQYKVSDMPTSILIDRQGRVRFTHKGFHSNEQSTYQVHINLLINEH
jgi:cytochrome c biogenesis protein CcmG, thiol:disulfide interchange protein DsbE